MIIRRIIVRRGPRRVSTAAISTALATMIAIWSCLHSAAVESGSVGAAAVDNHRRRAAAPHLLSPPAPPPRRDDDEVHIYVGPMLRNCPVEPPCYCAVGGGVTSSSAPVTSSSSSQQQQRHVVHRISCGVFSKRRRRFPCFVETNEVVERLSLTYSGLTVIPSSAFHALKVTMQMKINVFF